MEVFISDKVVIVDENKRISSGYTRTGNVYLLNDQQVIKLYHCIKPCYNDYHRCRLDILREQKVEKFIMPHDIAYDENGNIIGHTMKYVTGRDGDTILRLNSKFFIEELEKVYYEVSTFSQNNIILDDLASCNVKVNDSGIFFIDTDDYIIRTRLDYDKNMNDNNFKINTYLKNVFARKYSYEKSVVVYNMFDSYDIFYKEAIKYYKPNQSVKSLVRRMIRKNKNRV